MIVLDLQQGSPEWIAARLGIPTASRFADILTPKTRKASASQGRYLCELVAERITGFPASDISTDLMRRGSSLEEEAAAAYEFDNDVTVTKVGLVMNDGRNYGCSPDRLVGEDGLLEIKGLAAANHEAAVLGIKDSDHDEQVQGQLWITGRKWADLFFYNPQMPTHTVRIERDEAFIADLAAAVEDFCARLEHACKVLAGEAESFNPDPPAAPAASGERRSRKGKDATSAAADPRGDAGAGKDARGTEPEAAAAVSVAKPLSDIERARAKREGREL